MLPLLFALPLGPAPARGGARAAEEWCGLEDPEQECELARVEMLQRSGEVRGAVGAAGGTGRAKLPTQLAWLHIAKCGASFMYTLLELPELCREPFTFCSEEGECDHEPAVQAEDVRAQCPGILVPSVCNTQRITALSRRYGWCAEYGFRKEYDSKSVNMVGFFRDPRNRVISEYKGRCPEDPDQRDEKCDIATFIDSRKGCMVHLLGYDGTVEPHCTNMHATDVTTEELARARKRLAEDFVFVGDTDCWQASICLFNTMFGTKCRRAQFETMDHSGSYEWTGTVQSPLFDFRDEFDEAIWRQAKEIFEQNLLRFNVSAASCRACLLEAGWSAGDVDQTDFGTCLPSQTSEKVSYPQTSEEGS